MHDFICEGKHTHLTKRYYVFGCVIHRCVQFEVVLSLVAFTRFDSHVVEGLQASLYQLRRQGEESHSTPENYDLFHEPLRAPCMP